MKIVTKCTIGDKILFRERGDWQDRVGIVSNIEVRIDSYANDPDIDVEIRYCYNPDDSHATYWIDEIEILKVLK